MNPATISAVELARRIRANSHVHCTTEQAQNHLDWFKAIGYVDEPLPDRFRLSDAGWDQFAGVLDPDDLERAA